MSDAETIKPFSIERPEEVLTPELLKNIQVLFKQLDLTVREIHYNLGSKWETITIDAHPENEITPPFCSCVRRHAALGKFCNSDREQFLKLLEKREDEKVASLQWVCPFGLRLLGVSFVVGAVRFAFRSSGWLEKGNEGMALTRTLTLLRTEQIPGGRTDILPLLRRQSSHSDAEFSRDSQTLGSLMEMVYDHANRIFEGKIQASKDSMLQRLRSVVVPLLSLPDLPAQATHTETALMDIMTFFHLRSVAFFFSDSEEPFWLRRIALCGASNGDVPNRISSSRLASEAPFDEGTAKITHQTEEYLPGARACIVKYPREKAALLAIWPSPRAEFLLDAKTFSEITRVLSIPVCLSQLVSELGKEAEGRLRQARNMTHTIRSNFQGILSDCDKIRASTAAIQNTGSLKDTTEHLEDIILYLRNLLLSQEIVDRRDLRRPRPLTFARQRHSLWSLVTKVEELLRWRAADLKIEINIDESIRQLSSVTIDSAAVSLALLLLMDNAIKYSHRGTVVKSRTLDLKGSEDERFIHLEIADFGIGVHPLEYEKIFEPYVQGSIIDHRRPISGQGLGLAAAREVARNHGGNVILSKCAAYTDAGDSIPEDEIRRAPPDSTRASTLLQHCLVIFRFSLPK